MVILNFNWLKRIFAGRQQNTPGPNAETSQLSYYNKLIPRRYRTYSLDVGKQKQLRALSRVGIVRRGIDVIKDGVLSLPYTLEPVGKVPTKQLELNKSIIKNVLNRPNLVHDYRAFFGMVLDDLITLDAGVWNQRKGGNPLRPLFLYAVDAITMEKLQPYDFTNPDGDMYLQRTPGIAQDKTFSPHDIKWLQKNHFTDNPYGLSPLEVMYRYLSYLMDAIDNAADIASVDTIKFVLALEAAESTKLKEAQEYIESVQGTGGIPLFGGKINSAQVGAINSDSLYIEWQKFLLTLCAKCLNLPESCLVTNDVNDRNNISEVRQQIIMEAIKPYADILELAINQQIIEAMGITNIVFKFVYEETEAQKKAKTDRINSMVTTEQITINEAREMQGISTKLPTEYGDYTLSEAKARINEKRQANSGGFNGSGDSKANNKTNDEKAGT